MRSVDYRCYKGIELIVAKKFNSTNAIIQALVDVRILEPSDGNCLIQILSEYLRVGNLLKLQEKPELISDTDFANEREWVLSMWQRFLKNDC